MNHTPKTIKAIQIANTIAKAAQQERLLGMATGSHAFRFHPVNNPAVHWSGVSQRTLSILRGNREAVGNNGGVVTGATIQYLSNDRYYNPRYTPTVGSLIEHDGFGLGIVEGNINYASNLGMTIGCFFEEADRTVVVFCDDLSLLDGELRGTTGGPDETIDSKAERVNLDSARVKALRARYDGGEAAEEEEEKEEAAFGEFMTNEFEAEAF